MKVTPNAHPLAPTTKDAEPADDDRALPSDKRKKSAGQVLVLFALTSVMIIGMVAVVIDVAWFWTNEQSMQKAADAGALAGAVYLPGNVSQAYSSAIAEAKKNGYVTGTNGAVVTPLQDSTNKRRLKVTISGPVQAYFAQVFCALTSCTRQISETVSGTAEFTLPVPMGSPQNYYGVGTYLYNNVNVNNNNNNNNTGFDPEGAVVSGGCWTTPTNAATQNTTYTTASTNNCAQQWNTFGLQSGAAGVPNDATLVVDGLEVQLNRVFIGGSGTSTNCYVKTEVSWNAGTTWSTAQNTSALNTTNTTVKTLGTQLVNGVVGWPYVGVCRLQRHQLPRSPDVAQRCRQRELREHAHRLARPAAGARDVPHRHDNDHVHGANRLRDVARLAGRSPARASGPRSSPAAAVARTAISSARRTTTRASAATRRPTPTTATWATTTPWSCPAAAAR